MNLLLNTLFVTQAGSYLHLDHDTIRVEKDGETLKRIPLHHIGGVTVFGHTLVSPALVEAMMKDGRSLVFLGRNGRFLGRVTGRTGGNVLLRRAQHAVLSDTARTANLARCFTAGKLQNCRQLLLRSAREGAGPEWKQRLSSEAARHADTLRQLEGAENLAVVRGLEGTAAAGYWGVFSGMVKVQQEDFKMAGRNRRPPRDRINALLSFIYTLLRADCDSALEAVGLDPQIGFLHTLRPGRAALSLDMMEELRPVLADRLALALVNLQQIQPHDFEVQPTGAVWLSDSGRRTVILQYQKRKQEEVEHPVLRQKLPYGLVPHAQARLLARNLRGDIPHYPPFTMK